MSRRRLWVWAPVVLALAGCGDVAAPSEPRTPALPTTAAAPTVVQSEHYRVVSTSDNPTTQRATQAAEALFEAYAVLFPDAGRMPADGLLAIRLYATREEFQANNRSRPWAEGYYHQGVCHAYLDATRANPFHWLLHEAVHQLNREVTGFAKEKWLNEGLATYLGSSHYAGGRLQPGVPDYGAYPLWWLRRWRLSGDWDTDVRAGKVIPLRALVTGQGGPPLDETVNAHYLGYWSLTHFLLHHDGGRHAQGYLWLVRHGGTLADFEARIGPLAQVEREWYAYLQQQVASAALVPKGDAAR